MVEMECDARASSKACLLNRSRWADMLRRILSRLNTADWLTLLYLAFISVLVIITRDNVPRWNVILSLHCGLSAMVIALAQGREGRARLLSHWYPVALFGLFFEEIGYLVHAIHPGWFDDWLIRIDYALFGVHPTLWLEQLSNYWLNEYMQLVYTTYLLLIPGWAAYLWWRFRERAFETFIVSMCAAYYLSYLGFILFPIEGPYHKLRDLQQVELAGGPFTALINLIEKHARVHGGAFPSTHVAGSVVVLISAYRCAPRLGYALTPLVLSICVATVYGRYHYAVDVVAGWMMGVVGCYLGAKLCGSNKGPEKAGAPLTSSQESGGE